MFGDRKEGKVLKVVFDFFEACKILRKQIEIPTFPNSLHLSHSFISSGVLVHNHVQLSNKPNKGSYGYIHWLAKQRFVSVYTLDCQTKVYIGIYRYIHWLAMIICLLCCLNRGSLYFLKFH